MKKIIKLYGTYTHTQIYKYIAITHADQTSCNQCNFCLEERILFYMSSVNLNININNFLNATVISGSLDNKHHDVSPPGISLWPVLVLPAIRSPSRAREIRPARCMNMHSLTKGDMHTSLRPVQRWPYPIASRVCSSPEALYTSGRFLATYNGHPINLL